MTTITAPESPVGTATGVPDATPDDVTRAVARARAVYDSGTTRSLAARRRNVDRKSVV